MRTVALAAGPPAALAAEFTAAWVGLAFHFRVFTENADALIETLERHPADTALSSAAAYDQHRRLFALLSSGLAAVDSLGYGLFALGGMLRPEAFPLSTPTDRRNATLGATLRVYGEAFHDQEITRLLFWHLNSREFGWWKEAHALLARRAVLRGDMAEDGSVAGALGREWRVRGVSVHADAVRARRAWLAEVCGEVLEEAATFAGHPG